MRAPMSFASHAARSLHDAGPLGRRRRRRLRGARHGAGRRRELATCRGRPADDLGHLREGIAEDVVEQERDPLGGVIESRTTSRAMSIHSSRVIRRPGRGDGVRVPTRQLRSIRHRLGNPLTDVALAACPSDRRRSRQMRLATVVIQAPGHRSPPLSRSWRTSGCKSPGQHPRHRQGSRAAGRQNSISLRRSLMTALRPRCGPSSAHCRMQGRLGVHWVAGFRGPGALSVSHEIDL